MFDQILTQGLFDSFPEVFRKKERKAYTNYCGELIVSTHYHKRTQTIGDALRVTDKQSFNAFQKALKKL